jgi:FlaA1/EpsC-like NDP-sugar epimerase
MGATKRVTEKLMHYYASKQNKTAFFAVRFGNVLNSNGSVIPTFRKQIEEGKIKITHKDMVRYFMTIDEAVQLILQCCVLGKNDEIFVLDMGEPVKIVDLANTMIRLYGKELGKDVAIEYIGMRPGEKLYEEPLTTIEETSATKNNKIFILNNDEIFEKNEFILNVERLIEYSSLNTFDKLAIIRKLKEIVPTYAQRQNLINNDEGVVEDE